MAGKKSTAGSIREVRSGVWQVRYGNGRDPVKGKYRQASRQVNGSRRDAQKALSALITEVDAGKVNRATATYFDLAEQWLAKNKRIQSPTTQRTYRNLLENHVYPALGNRRVNVIQTRDLDNLYDGLQDSRDLSNSTVRQIHAIIRRSLHQAVLWEWIANNPAVNATPPRQEKPDLTPPDPDEVGQLLRAAYEKDEQFGNFLRVAATTGARRGEICALTWDNLDLEDATLTIEKSIIEVSGGLRKKDTKTHASRSIALGKTTMEVFEAQRRNAEERAALVGQSVSEDSYMFSHEPDGHKPWRPGNVTHKFAEIKHELGYHNVRLHDLRHFAATEMMAGGLPVRTVSGRLGHANPATTLSVYSHFVPASDQDAAGFMDNRVNVAKSKPDKKTNAKKHQPSKRKPPNSRR
jgi:integrase